MESLLGHDIFGNASLILKSILFFYEIFRQQLIGKKYQVASVASVTQYLYKSSTVCTKALSSAA